jgi:excisionase family DNA binding protein
MHDVQNYLKNPIIAQQNLTPETLMSDTETVNPESNKPESTPTDVPPCRTWTAKQVAARLGCSDRHVLRMADEGKMPWGFKIGWLRKWEVDVIEKWVAAGAKPVRQSGGRK